jgi:hypothetical protein
MIAAPPHGGAVAGRLARTQSLHETAIGDAPAASGTHADRPAPALKVRTGAPDRVGTRVSTPTTLYEGQYASLDLGGGVDAIPCRVLAFAGPDVVLLPESALSPEARERLGERLVYLVLESDGALQALRGVVHGTGDRALRIRLADDIRLGQRRLFSRAPLALPVRLRPAGGEGGEWSSTALDVSAGGIRVRRLPGMPEAPAYDVTIDLTQLEREIAASGELIRAGEDDLALRYTRIAPEDVALLMELALTYFSRALA